MMLHELLVAEHRIAKLEHVPLNLPHVIFPLPLAEGGWLFRLLFLSAFSMSLFCNGQTFLTNFSHCPKCYLLHGCR